jgi:hypothetical protein
MGKLYAAIRSFRCRLGFAWMVFREDPDEVVAMSETEGGSVGFRHAFGVGIAGNYRKALEGIAIQYGLFHGEPGLTGNETGEPITDGGLTKPCPDCKGSGEFVVLQKDGEEITVTGREAWGKYRNGEWEYEGVRECSNCVGYGHVDARTGEI